MTECIKHGCRYLQTTCLTCGKVVCTKTWPEPMEWISVKDQPPLEETEVLFSVSKDRVNKCGFSPGPLKKSRNNAQMPKYASMERLKLTEKSFSNLIGGNYE